MKLLRYISVGSLNPCKLAGVESVTRRFPFADQAQVVGLAAPSGVSAQPKGLPEIFRGAANRAARAVLEPVHLPAPPWLAPVRPCLGVGIESGVLTVERESLDYGTFDVCAAVLVDQTGRIIGSGMSAGFEVPPKVAHAVVSGAEELSVAFRRLGLTQDPALGRNNGAVGLLTRDRLTRQQQVEQAVLLAFARLDVPELYDSWQGDEEP